MTKGSPDVQATPSSSLYPAYLPSISAASWRRRVSPLASAVLPLRLDALRLALRRIDPRYPFRVAPFDARLLIPAFLARCFTANVRLRPLLSINRPRLWRLSSPGLA